MPQQRRAKQLVAAPRSICRVEGTKKAFLACSNQPHCSRLSSPSSVACGGLRGGLLVLIVDTMPPPALGSNLPAIGNNDQKKQRESIASSFYRLVCYLSSSGAAAEGGSSVSIFLRDVAMQQHRMLFEHEQQAGCRQSPPNTSRMDRSRQRIMRNSTHLQRRDMSSCFSRSSCSSRFASTSRSP